jgi:membrane peptidoglycan carboxypeptidase
MNPDIILNCSSPMQITSTWTVKNYGNHQYGYRSLASATAISSNTAYAQVAEAIGADAIVDTAYSMGITSTLSRYLSITLGAVSVSPLEMCDAYSTLASGGLHRDAVCITKIEDRNGNVVYEHQDNPTRAVSEAVAEAVTNVLEGVVANGATGYYVADYNTTNQPIAGKTGTSDDAEDLWFCGYTPQITCAVWSGYPDARVAVTVNGGVGTTQNTVQPIWTNFMNKVLAGVAREEFPTTTDTVDYKDNSSWTFVGTSASTNSTSYNTVSETTTTTTNPQPTTNPTTSESTGPNTGNGGNTSGSGTGGSGSGSGSGSGTGNTGGNTGGETGGGGTSGTGETGGGSTGENTGGTTGGGTTGR